MYGHTHTHAFTCTHTAVLGRSDLGRCGGRSSLGKETNESYEAKSAGIAENRNRKKTQRRLEREGTTCALDGRSRVKPHKRTNSHKTLNSTQKVRASGGGGGDKAAEGRAPTQRTRVSRAKKKGKRVRRRASHDEKGSEKGTQKERKGRGSHAGRKQPKPKRGGCEVGGAFIGLGGVIEKRGPASGAFSVEKRKRTTRLRRGKGGRRDGENT